MEEVWQDLALPLLTCMGKDRVLQVMIPSGILLWKIWHRRALQIIVIAVYKTDSRVGGAAWSCNNQTQGSESPQ